MSLLTFFGCLFTAFTPITVFYALYVGRSAQLLILVVSRSDAALRRVQRPRPCRADSRPKARRGGRTCLPQCFLLAPVDASVVPVVAHHPAYAEPGRLSDRLCRPLSGALSLAVRARAQVISSGSRGTAQKGRRPVGGWQALTHQSTRLSDRGRSGGGGWGQAIGEGTGRRGTVPRQGTLEQHGPRHWCAPCARFGATACELCIDPAAPLREGPLGAVTSGGPGLWGHEQPHVVHRRSGRGARARPAVCCVVPQSVAVLPTRSGLARQRGCGCPSWRRECSHALVATTAAVRGGGGGNPIVASAHHHALLAPERCVDGGRRRRVPQPSVQARGLCHRVASGRILCGARALSGRPRMRPAG